LAIAWLRFEDAWGEGEVYGANAIVMSSSVGKGEGYVEEVEEAR